MRIVSLKVDFSMKELFNNEIVRKYFVSDLLDIPVDQIRSVQMKNPFLRKRYRRQKQGILDVLVELNNDTKINIEMQVKRYADWDKRSLFYLAKMYSDELIIGENYKKLKRCVQVSILDFNLLDGDNYHTIYRLRDENGREYSDLFEIHVIELNKKLNGNSRMDDWIRLFNAENEEDLKMIKSKSEGIIEAIREIRSMSLGERIRLQFEAHLKAKRDQNAWEEYWKTEGRAAGHAEGRAAGHAEGRAEGRAEGHAEGEWSSYISLIRKKVIKGMNASEIAEVLEMELPLIQELVRLINSNPGVTDEELVAQWLCKK